MRVEHIDQHSVNIVWDAPVKNPQSVEMYRVFWRLIDEDTNSAKKMETPDRHFRIEELKEGVIYECVIKAGNHKGTSVLTEAVRFSTTKDG